MKSQERRKARRVAARRPLMTTVELAELLGCSQTALIVARSTGRGAYATIPFYRLGRWVKFCPDQVDRWLEAHRAEGPAA
jgi:Helix-turn-helix domain